MSIQLYRDRAIVLGHHSFGEADKIIKLLTYSHGLTRAVAKGIRRTRSKFGAHLEPFSYVDIQIHPSPRLGIITQVSCLESFSAPLSADYEHYTCACSIIETAEQLATGELATTTRLYRLTLGALRALSTDTHPYRLILDAYLIRAMALTGWAPTLHTCVRCNAPGPHELFHIPSGGTVCSRCRPLGARRVRPGTLELINALQCGHWDYAYTSTQGQRYCASGLIAGYFQWHTEKRLRTLAFLSDEHDPLIDPPRSHPAPTTCPDPPPFFPSWDTMIDNTHPLVPMPAPTDSDPFVP